MSGVIWTESQAEAIRLRGKNIIVSAAAGSGKTAVLVERIKQLILEDGVAIDEILVATFTNAAAGDMREKIVKAILAEIGKRPEQSFFLRQQLNLIHKANIGTFHSFALEVVRRYFHFIGVEPNFKICDDAEKTILQGESLDELFEENFACGNEEFPAFLDWYSTAKTDKNAKEMVLSLYEMVRTLPDPFGWLSENVALLSKSEDELRSRFTPAILRDARGTLAEASSALVAVREILLEHGIDSLAEKCERDLAKIRIGITLAAGGDLETLAAHLAALEFERFAARKEEREGYEEIKEQIGKLREKGKDAVKELRELYFSVSFAEAAEAIHMTQSRAETLQELVLRFHQLFSQQKREKNLIDFADAEHMALTILSDRQIAEEYRKKFKYIFVDEYQDSNLLQETMVERIKRENNVFLVGDVKQSIYKFRLAEPELFLSKYEAFKRNAGGSDAKIDLNTNFRCKGNIIDAVNAVCERIMPYDENAALRRGVDCAPELNHPVELHLVDARKLEEEGVDPEINELKKAELEAGVAAELIRSLLGTEISCREKDGSEAVRRLTYRDMVILKREVKNEGETFYRILAEKGIPTYIDDSGGYFDSLEIEIFLNLLKVIDNRRQDVPLLSLLHSSIFGFSVEDLAIIRMAHRKGSFCEAFLAFGAEGEEEKLRNRCAEVLLQIQGWRKLSGVLPLDEFLHRLMHETGFFIYAGALPGGTQRQANLRALADKAQNYSRMQTDGLYGFLRYTETLKTRGVQTGQVSLAGENDDVVRMMTIHKSKGLEFPVVFVAGLGKKFMAGRGSGDLAIHKDVGIGMRYLSEGAAGKEKNLIQTLIERKKKEEEQDEETRVLYVALTRAKDRLILLGSAGDVDRALAQYAYLDPGNRRMTSCFLDMVTPVFLQKNLWISAHQRSEFSLTAEKSNTFRSEFEKILEGKREAASESELSEEIHRRLTYEYANKAALSTKSKHSVSELSRKGSRRIYEKPFAVPQFLQGGRKLSGAEIGTAVHRAIEKMDFAAAAAAFRQGTEQGRAYLGNLLTMLCETCILTPEETEKVDPRKLERFILSDTGQRAARADLLHKESPFNLLKEIDGIETIVQGVIDCCFLEGNSYVLLDYKTNYITDRDDDIERIKEEYREQIDIYAEALEILKGKPVKERYLYLLALDLSVEV